MDFFKLSRSVRLLHTFLLLIATMALFTAIVTIKSLDVRWSHVSHKAWNDIRSSILWSSKDVYKRSNSIHSVDKPNHNQTVSKSIFRKKDKWVVIDGLSADCQDVFMFTNRRDWNVIVVSSLSFPPVGCKKPNCIWVNEMNIASHLKGLTMGRNNQTLSKIAGYLLAIRYGAQLILDAWCIMNSLVHTEHDNPLWYYPNLSTSHVFYANTSLFNPYQHFGVEKMYPKLFQYIPKLGFPPQTDCSFYAIGCRRHHTNSNMYLIGDTDEDEPVIWQSVSDSQALCGEQQDSDSDFSTHHKNTSTTHLPPVSVRSNTFVPLDTGFTLFSKETFAAMFIPPDWSHSMQRVFRSVYVHKYRSIFSQFPVTYMYSKSKDRCSKPDMVRESNVSLDIDYIIRMSADLACHFSSERAKSSICASELARKVADVIQRNNRNSSSMTSTLNSFRIWIEDLKTLNFSFPQVTARNKPSYKYSNYFRIKYSKYLENLYVYNKNSPPNDYREKYLNNFIFKPMHSLCNESKDVLKIDNWRSPLIDDVMLIVAINYVQLFNVVPYVEYIYRSSFRHIVYCGPKATAFNKFAQSHGVAYVTFIEGYRPSWILMYECMGQAMKLGVPVKGYIHIGDDTMVNMNKLYLLPRNQIWMPNLERILYIDSKVPNRWVFWNTIHGRNALINILTELAIMAVGEVWENCADSVKPGHMETNCQFARRFLNNLKLNSLGRHFAIHMAMDFFYIPENLKLDFLRATKIFSKHNCIVELAIPMISRGLALKTDSILVNSTSIWGDKRNTPWMYFDEDVTTYLHPFKGLSSLGSPEGKKFLCDSYIPNVIMNKGLD